VHQLDAGANLEQFGGKVRHAADALPTHWVVPFQPFVSSAL
jgi:hypothetical protein